MDHLSPAQIQQLRSALEADVVALNTSLDAQAGEIAATQAPDPQDIEEAAAEEARRFRRTQLRERERVRLTEVEAALARLADGSYGICEDSGEEIPFRRLELEPTTRFTVEAQEQLEHEAVADPHAHEPGGY